MTAQTNVLIDTSVLLVDPEVMVRVTQKGGLPFVTNTILTELDFNKKNQDQAVSRNARLLLRAFAEIQATTLDELPDGKPLLKGDALRRLTFSSQPVHVLVRDSHRSRENNDSKIIEVAKDYGMVLITRDNGLKVRADTDGVEAYVWTGPEDAQGRSKRQNGQIKPLSDQLLRPFAAPQRPIAETDSPLAIDSLPVEGETVATTKSGNFRLGKAIKSGGEGTIFETDRADIVCKIYHKYRLTSLRKKKVELMLSRNVKAKGICWPLDVVLNNRKEFVGFIMPKAQGRPLQSTMFIKPVLEKNFPNWTRTDLVKLCLAFLDQIDYLHSLNIIVGDINPLNFLVDSDSAKLCLVDTDSFQVEGFPCPVGTVNFTAPHIQGKDYSHFLRSKDDELFAVATMLFMILLPGKPPYAQQGGGNPAENIRAMDFSYPFDGESNRKAPAGPWQNIWGNLPWGLRKAFWATFKEGKRINVEEWRSLLNFYLESIHAGKHSNDLFPTTFKIHDPVDVICGKCGKSVIASKRRVSNLSLEGKPYYCGDCLTQVRLEILAHKSKLAHRDTLQSLANSSRSSDWHARSSRGHSSSTWSTPQVSSNYSGQPSQRTGTGSGEGILDWLLRMFR